MEFDGTEAEVTAVGAVTKVRLRPEFRLTAKPSDTRRSPCPNPEPGRPENETSPRLRDPSADCTHVRAVNRRARTKCRGCAASGRLRWRSENDIRRART